MEAPDIIWLSPNEYRPNEPSCFWSESQRTDYDIEYIRKDAFIEKACKFFELPRIYKITGMGFFVDVVDNQMIEDFKKYMEK